MEGDTPKSPSASSVRDNPDYASVMAWARRPTEVVSRIRNQAPQHGLDPQRLVQGYVLQTVLGDDSNSFGLLSDRSRLRKLDVHFPEIARLSILERLTWEASISELPEDIRTLVTKTRDTINAMDFSTDERLEEGYQIWRTMRDTIERLVEETPSLQEARQYARENRDKLQEPKS